MQNKEFILENVKILLEVETFVKLEFFSKLSLCRNTSSRQIDFRISLPRQNDSRLVDSNIPT